MSLTRRDPVEVGAPTLRASRSTDSWRNSAIAIVDWAAMALAVFVVCNLLGAGDDEPFGSRYDAPLLVASVMVLFAAQQGWYSSSKLRRGPDRVGRIWLVGAWTMGVVAMAVLVLGSRSSRPWHLITMTVAATATLTVTHMFWKYRGRLADQPQRLAIVGNGDQARHAYDRVSRDRRSTFEPIGIISTSPDEASWLGTVEKVLGRLSEYECTAVMVAAASLPPVQRNQIVRQLADAGLDVLIDTGINGLGESRLQARTMSGNAGVFVEPTERTVAHRAAKRVFDLAFSLLALPVVCVSIAIAAVAIKIDSRGPVFFVQERVGRRGRTFKMIKLRTMSVGADDLVEELADDNEREGNLFKLADDPRVTSVGRVLRRYSIDELPQFFNVLVGTMSVVGPRPALPREAVEWTSEVKRRIVVPPGITGLWQVEGRTDNEFDTYVALDNEYVDTWSVASDSRIVARTVGAVVSGTGK